MVKTTQEYLSKILTNSGIKTRILYTYKELTTTTESHIGAVLLLGDTPKRNRAKKAYEINGVKKIRKKLYDRNIKYSIVIGDYTVEKCSLMYEKFLELLDEGIYIDGNYTGITLSEADWVYKEDSILRANVAVQFEITFEGGLYKDNDLKVFENVEIIAETEGL